MNTAAVVPLLHTTVVVMLQQRTLCQRMPTHSRLTAVLLLLLVVVLVATVTPLPAAAAAAAAAAEVVVAPVRADNTVVYTENGPIKGFVDDGVLIFRGVPYAAPPVGNLRFVPAQPVASNWTDPLDCTKFRSVCPQFEEFRLVVGSEDCLYLDIYIPLELPHTDPLPVMLWLYGGGYTIGDGYELGLYDGKHLAQKHDVIIVSPNYRLSAFGFLSLAELQAESGTTGLYGVQDQRQALLWTRNNIAAFGGNPNAVTLFGESAGAFSVCFHLTSEASRGLFHAAIMESGTCSAPEFYLSPTDADSFSADYASSCGCNRTELGSASKFLDCLRGLDTASLMKSLISFWDWPLKGTGYKPLLAPFMPFGMTVDGTAVGLKQVPLLLIKQNQFHRVPLIIGTNQNEGSIFIAMFPFLAGVFLPLSEHGLHKSLDHFFNDSIVEQTLALYKLSDYKNNDHRGAAILRDYFFTCEARRIVRYMADTGNPAYLYHFKYGGDWIEYPVLGDYHSAELEFVWDNAWPPLVHIFSKNDTAMAASFGSFWTNMAKSLTPNAPEPVSVHWDPYSRHSDNNMVMDVPLSVDHNQDETVCDFWDSIDPL